MGVCNRCGMCCRAIALLFSKKDIKERWLKDSGNREFVLKHWKRISKEQAVKNNPNVASIQKEYVRGNQKTYWYECKLLSGNDCSIHEDRPAICEGYPWYGTGPKRKEFLYGANCGFKLDQLLGEEVNDVQFKKKIRQLGAKVIHGKAQSGL
jgi:Fe-S-cluster containining protein